jgi:uncharacterized sulfatase
MDRRTFLAAPLALPQAAAESRPNILWITCEDLCPLLGCYGDLWAATPNLDRLASEGTRYRRAYSPAPVCTPSRSCLITGMFANSLGSMHLRGMVAKPTSVPCFPEYLQAAGYYTSNNAKEDYDFEAPPGCWHDSSNKAHWRNRQTGQPFFAVFNLGDTHQGQIRYDSSELQKRNAALPARLRHDPSGASLPLYFPDTPAVRGQQAALYTQVTRMDARAGTILAELEADGLAGDTIVFFFSDHGTGLPRGKRFLNQTGLHVPLIIRFPEKYRSWAPTPPGGETDRLVSFVDFAPTVLSLAGLRPPAHQQGQAFLGPSKGKTRDRIFAARDRVDEEVEVSRTVFDGRWQYIRHFMPHRPVMQHGAYSEVGATWRELRRLDAAGQLRGPEKLLMERRKAPEELYDVKADPHQLRNLALDPKHASEKKRLHGELRQWMLQIRDTGLLPEPEMAARCGNRPPFSLTPAEFPLPDILTAAGQVGFPPQPPAVRRGLASPDAAVRYWTLVALIAGENGTRNVPVELAPFLRDPAAIVRIAAAELGIRSGQTGQSADVLKRELQAPDARTRLLALATLYHLPASIWPIFETALRDSLKNTAGPEYQFTYCSWAIAKMLPAGNG